MVDHIYKHVEITGTSTETVEEAIENAIAHAGQTVRNLRWFEVSEVRGDIMDDRQVGRWQVTLKIGFILDR